MVRRVGPRHNDHTAGPGAGDGPTRSGSFDPAIVNSLHRSGHAPECVPGPKADRCDVQLRVDAALWYIEAVRQYHSATSDLALVGELYEKLTSIIDWHVHGTRYSIHMDTADGLLHAGELGVQLTWMDAKVGDQVVTSRIGKPVEVNALWYSALCAMSAFAAALGKPAEDYNKIGGARPNSFSRFWNPAAGCCFDVLDGPGGNDPSLRPNQILAASLQECPHDAGAAKKAVVDVCARRLVTRNGLRSLDAADQRYQGHYGGPQEARDAAYHQGTVWAWLLGPFVVAHLRTLSAIPNSRSRSSNRWRIICWPMGSGASARSSTAIRPSHRAGP